MEVGEKNLECIALLDKANTETYGTPTPVTVPLTVEKGPFIVITGHDLHDLKLLLEQTEGKDVNVYTHGEILPAHAYPELKKYPHLKGNFGTAWQNQQKEFADIPAPVLFTTNILMPPRPDNADRVFTTALVSYPEITHIGEDKDFIPVIEKVLALADAFGCGVNDLPLSLVLSWYEQKAVCILLTLLHLGIKNIRLGPTLPAFISPKVLSYLVENFHIAPATTPEEDLKALLKRRQTVIRLRRGTSPQPPFFESNPEWRGHLSAPLRNDYFWFFASILLHAAGSR